MARSTLDKKGTRTVGFSETVMFTNFPATLEIYRRRYPKVELPSCKLRRKLLNC